MHIKSDPVADGLTADERIAALSQLHPKGYDLSLDRISILLEKLNNPQDRLPPVMHFAGTNGKGSTIAFTRSILEAAGLGVHVHTSPHLVSWSERYRLGRSGAPGELVDDQVLSAAIARVAEANDGNQITVFEILTAVMFVLFSEHPADVCLVEVGLGGRFDSTNVMNDVDVSIITPVSIDHEAFLGNTLAKIAFEKAGIIKRKTPLVVGHQKPEALAVIEEVARKHASRTLIADEDFRTTTENGRLVYSDEESLLDLAMPALPGTHQLSNAATAIAAAKLFCEIHNVPLDQDQIDSGIKKAQWPGRMQHLTHGDLHTRLPENTDLWLDGGHNPDAGKAAAAFLEDLAKRDPRPLTLICGMLDTKDVSGYLQQFSKIAKTMMAVPILSSDAGVDPDKLIELATAAGIPSKAMPSLQDALKAVENGKPCRVLIAGSLYLAGDALEQNGTFPT